MVRLASLALLASLAFLDVPAGPCSSGGGGAPPEPLEPEEAPAESGEEQNADEGGPSDDGAHPPS
ncbi:MAG TPA: hypothetical protein RMH85_01910 [Polyangiaceae bacterium LLY-WYZ-15_(1-7)]|nr:hypothetical protein [Myxococcales bacterium]MAT25671.1 hypothetical protein [Sandaracinus sp.]HJK89171.1 hypothetical protein [Polyangiaceae bacterium LLY-WYZ-15_(1-7)]MBJ74268.1 hypothetical protein [Sandaracinus sp.]HJL00241.1 hypothetical protein [Polyangiaceae bacterium LLY-WYZ-15_(1-7)]